MKPLPRSFYLRPTITVAKELLGKYLVRKIRGKTLVGKIVEVEAYLGSKDPASHAYRGMTKRNEVMFRKGGHLYVYFTYGMHFCANVVTEDEGIGHAVLLRAVEPVQGIEVMAKNRRITADFTKKTQIADNADLCNLTNGPAKLCQALSIARKENGTDLIGSTIFILGGESILPSRIVTKTRIGIRKATDKRWRYYIKHHPFVSKK
jgi:DNA-3-methyladenine glycosylase